MRQLKIITCQPDDTVFFWQTKVQLTNFRRYGYSDKCNILIFIPNDRLSKGLNPRWTKLIEEFPETKFFIYEDTENLFLNYIKKFDYIPLLRPYVLEKHFSLYPELEKDAILYIDSDVIFTQKPLSDTQSYIAASYFDSKIKDVREDKLELYKTLDVLNDLLSGFNLTREVAVKNENNSGGAQYLLKNINAQFWKDVFVGCLLIKRYLPQINQRFFKGDTPLDRENSGFQSWCADMFSLLWNLWKRGYETQTPKIMDFAWATDDISKWDKVYLYHDAGGSRKDNLFDKRQMKYIRKDNAITPFEDDLSFVDKNFCSYLYVKEIQSVT
jgi:hypothetical protein